MNCSTSQVQMPEYRHWLVRATRAAATTLYVVSILCATGLLLAATFLGALNPHSNYLSALDTVTGYSVHPLRWKVLLSFAGLVTVVDVVLRLRWRAAKN